MGYRRTRRHKNGKNKRTRSKRYKRHKKQRGGNDLTIQPTIQPKPDVIDETLKKTSEGIKNIEEESKNIFSGFADTISSFFGSQTETPPTQTAGKKRKYKK